MVCLSSSGARATRLVLAMLVAAATIPVLDASAQGLANARGKVAQGAMKLPTQKSPALVGPNGVLIYGVYPQEQTLVDTRVEYDTQTCALISSGTWAITSQPKSGTTAFGIFNGTLANGDCPGVVFPFAAVYYTWTNTKKGVLKDTFKAEWTSPDYVEDDSYVINLIYLKVNLVSQFLKINGVSPLTDTTQYVITDTPDFPEINATAQVVNASPDPTATTQFTWTEKLSVKKGTGQKVSYAQYLQQSQTTTGTAEYDLQRTDNTVLVGGDLELDIAATVDGHALTGATSGVTIIGTNPQRSAIQDRITTTVPTLSLHGLNASDVTDVNERITCLESQQREFNASADGGTGAVLISSDNGVGISQLTNPSPFSDPNLLFNWQSNTDQGVSIYGDKIPVANNFPGRLHQSVTYRKSLIGVNRVRAMSHLSPITIVPAPAFTRVGVIGSNPTDQLLEDATRGYNGYGGNSKYGLPLHEFEPNLPYLETLPDDQLPGLATDANVWLRVPAADRGKSGNPNYVQDVTNESPQCGG